MASTRDNWKQTGKGLGHAFRDLGKTLVKTAKTGVDKATDWAEKDDNNSTVDTAAAPTEGPKSE